VRLTPGTAHCSAVATLRPVSDYDESLTPSLADAKAKPRASAEWWSSGWRGVRYPILCFLTLAALLYLSVYLSNEYLVRNAHYPIREHLVFRGAGVLEGWVRYDGGWYGLIASRGYSYQPGAQSAVAFFPGYPMSMRAVGWVLGDVFLAGVAITFASGLTTAVLMYRWCLRVLSEKTARAAVLMMLLFPYAWYVYGAVYADALFLMCVLAAFVLVEQDRPVLAGAVAAVATATRPIGIGVIVGLVVVHLEHRDVIAIPYLDRVRQLGWRAARREHQVGRDPLESEANPLPPDAKESRQRPVSLSLAKLRTRDAGVLLACSGLAGWCAYLASAYGNPLLFSEIEGAPGWDQAQGPSTWLKVEWFRALSELPHYVADLGQFSGQLVFTMGLTFQGALAIACVALLPLVVRRIGWSYAVYTLAVVMLPVLGTKDWQGTGRYLLAAFPVFAALADWMLETHRGLLRSGFVASGLLLVLLTTGYARGYYLA